MSLTGQKPCRICQTGQRISTATFAFFAVALFFVATDPQETALRQVLMMFCAVLSGIAAFRFPIARMVAKHRAGQAQGKTRSSHENRKRMP